MKKPIINYKKYTAAYIKINKTKTFTENESVEYIANSPFAFYAMVDNFLFSLFEFILDQNIQQNTKDDYIKLLTASYLRTNVIIENLILQGDYYESFILLRKQLESAARSKELGDENKSITVFLNSKIPNVGNAFNKSLNELKTILSEYTHVSKIETFLNALPKRNNKAILYNKMRKLTLKQSQRYRLICNLFYAGTLLRYMRNFDENFVESKIDEYADVLKTGIKIKALRISKEKMMIT